MGSSYSSEPAVDDAITSQFDPDELKALRNAFATLASSSTGVIEADAFADLRPGVPWTMLWRRMAGVSSEPVRWHRFIEVIARCCKGRRSERVEFITSLYSADGGAADGGSYLTAASLKALLSDALAAARGGSTEPDPSSSIVLDAVVSEVFHSVAADRVPVTHWTQWAGMQLPSLPLAQETFVLKYLCAIGCAASAAKSGRPATLLPFEAEVPLDALAAVQEPLLLPASGQSEGTELLTPSQAWLISLAMRRASAAEAAEWRCLYASRVMGLSMNRFAHHATGYPGPVLMVVLTEKREVFAAYVDTPLKPSDKYFGGTGCALCTLQPAFHLYAPTGISKNFALYNPPQTGALASEAYFHRGSAAAAVPEVIGFGGQTARLRLSLEDDLNMLRWHGSDTTYAAHPLGADAAPPDGARRVLALELWGCGGADAERIQRELIERRHRDATRAGKVDRAAMFGLNSTDWRSEDNPDRMILETAGAHTFYSAQLEKLPEERS